MVLEANGNLMTKADANNDAVATSQHCDAKGDVLNGKPDSSPDCGSANCASMDTDSGGKLWSRRVWCLWARLSA